MEVEKIEVDATGSILAFENGPTVLETFSPFVDVSAEDWFFDAVIKAENYGDMTGVSDTEFQPNGTMTRAMLVTVLYRMSGATDTGIPSFADVPADTWYTNAVAWAEKNNIVNGTGDKTFSPNARVTREQVAAILYRYLNDMGYRSATSEISFDDAADIDAWALDSVQMCANLGLMNGVAANEFRPKANCTRAEVATIVARLRNCIENATETAIKKIEIAHFAYGVPIREFKLDLDKSLCYEYTSADFITQRDENAENEGYQAVTKIQGNQNAFFSDLARAGILDWEKTQTNENGYNADAAKTEIDIYFSDRLYQHICCDGSFPGGWDAAKAAFEWFCGIDVLLY